MSPALVLDQAVAAIHLLSAAGWFGALVYRAFFVDPRAMRYLNGDSNYEHFSLHLADGMRYVVMLALLTCGLSGFVLAGLRWSPAEGWLALVAGKAGLWAVAFALFAYISWVYWPRRVFATTSEWPGVRRQGMAMALVMIGVAGAGIVLGQVGQAVRMAGPGAIGTAAF